MPNLSKHRQNSTLISLGESIRLLRRDRKMSQEELSLAAEVDLSYIGRVERGDNNVAILTLQKIAGALGVTLEQLMKIADL